DRVCHLVSGEAIDTIVTPRGLVRRIIGHLVLEENSAAVLAIPDDLIFLEVLYEQAVSRDVITIDDESGIRRVEGPSNAGTVVRTPRPDVVEQHIVAVHD